MHTRATAHTLATEDNFSGAGSHLPPCFKAETLVSCCCVLYSKSFSCYSPASSCSHTRGCSPAIPLSHQGCLFVCFPWFWDGTHSGCRACTAHAFTHEVISWAQQFLVIITKSSGSDQCLPDVPTVEETNTISRTHSSLLVRDEEEEEDSASGARAYRKQGGQTLDQGTLG